MLVNDLTSRMEFKLACISENERNKDKIKYFKLDRIGRYSLFPKNATKQPMCNLIRKNAKSLPFFSFSSSLSSWESHCVNSDTSNHPPWIPLKGGLENASKRVCKIRGCISFFWNGSRIIREYEFIYIYVCISKIQFL